MSGQSKVVDFRNSAEFLRECAARHAESDPLRALDFLRRAREEAPEMCAIDREEADVLSRMGCPYEATLALARSTAGERLPGESWFELAGSLMSMGLLRPALEALRLYLAQGPNGENADAARELLALIGLSREARPGKRRACLAAGVAVQAARLVGEARYEQARRVVERGLRWRENDRQLLILKVKCDLYTGREEEARELAAQLMKNEFADDLLTLGLVLSERAGNDALIERILDIYLPCTLEAETRLAVFRLCLNREDEPRLRSLLPGLLREAPYDRGVLHAAAVATLKSGRREDACWYWRQMLRIRPGDALAAQCLEADAADSWRLRLKDERTEQLRAACLQPGERLIELARWALDMQENDALRRLCPELAECPAREAELILREALAHPFLRDEVKRSALAALRRRGARSPFLLITQEGVRCLEGEYEEICSLPHALERLRGSALAALEQLADAPETHRALEEVWQAAIDSQEARRLLRRNGGGTAALLALTLERCGREDALARLAGCLGTSVRRLHFDAARLSARMRRTKEIHMEVLGHDEAD